MPTFLHPVYLHISPLPRLCLPAEVIRRSDMTLIWIDPTALRAEIAFWNRDHLTPGERLSLRAAFHQSLDLDVPLDDQLVSGLMGSMDIPPMLRLPDDGEAATA